MSSTSDNFYRMINTFWQLARDLMTCQGNGLQFVKEHMVRQPNLRYNFDDRSKCLLDNDFKKIYQGNVLINWLLTCKILHDAYDTNNLSSFQIVSTCILTYNPSSHIFIWSMFEFLHFQRVLISFQFVWTEIVPFTATKPSHFTRYNIFLCIRCWISPLLNMKCSTFWIDLSGYFCKK